MVAVSCGYVYAVGGAAANADGTKLASSTIDVMDLQTLRWRVLPQRLATAGQWPPWPSVNFMMPFHFED